MNANDLPVVATGPEGDHAKGAEAGRSKDQIVEQASTRGDWLEASLEVSRLLVGVTETRGVGDVAQHIIEQVRRLGQARTVTLVGPHDLNEAHFEVRLAAGSGAVDLVGNTYEKERTIEGRAMQENHGFISSAEESRCHHLDTGTEEPAGSLLAVPLDWPEHLHGAIVASRGLSQAPFTTTDLAMAQDFARQSSIALHLAEGRALREQMRFHEQRDVEVRQLHDDLVQQLFGLGVTIESLRKTVHATAGTSSDSDAFWQQTTDQINAIINQLRSTLSTSPDSAA